LTVTDKTQGMSGNRNLVLALSAILLAPGFCGTGVCKVVFDGMTWYHSKDSTGRLLTNDDGQLVWQCRKPDQLVAHLKSPMKISSIGDVAEFRILWKSSGQVLGPDCRRKLCHDDCVICLAGTGDFRMGLFDSSGGRRITRDLNRMYSGDGGAISGDSHLICRPANRSAGTSQSPTDRANPTPTRAFGNESGLMIGPRWRAGNHGRPWGMSPLPEALRSRRMSSGCCRSG